MEFLWSLLYCCTSSFTVYIVYMCWHFRTFSKQGIPVPNKPIPIFGTLLQLMRQGQIEAGRGMLEKYGKISGGFNGRLPVLNTIDFDIIRQVFIKDQENFPNRMNFVSGDEMSDLMLNNISKRDHWKYLRSVTSPTFSSGKLRRMIPQLNKCARQMISHMEKQVQLDKSLEVKEYAGSFTMDAIASTAFGLNLDTKQDANNTFVKYAKMAFEFDFKHPVLIILFFLPFLVPLLPYFKLHLVKKEIADFFTGITDQVLDARKEDTGKNDFIGLMMNSHKELASNDGEHVTRAMTRQEITSQVLLFFLAGYETTATSISFLVYLLALNPEKQELLLEEIDRVTSDRAGNEDVTDDQLQSMPYLEMCINESLRLYPPASAVMRSAKHDVVLKGIHLPKGSVISVPVYHLHHYAEIYPHPEAFLPERFSSEERSKRDPLSFLPFGAGPRQCIATRLGMLEIKMAMVHILQKYRIVRAAETEVPLKLSKLGLLKADNGVWVKLKTRKEN